jgi:hypothetical protein
LAPNTTGIVYLYTPDGKTVVQTANSTVAYNSQSGSVTESHYLRINTTYLVPTETTTCGRLFLYMNKRYGIIYYAYFDMLISSRTTAEYIIDIEFMGYGFQAVETVFSTLGAVPTNPNLTYNSTAYNSTVRGAPSVHVPYNKQSTTSDIFLTAMPIVHVNKYMQGRVPNWTVLSTISAGSAITRYLNPMGTNQISQTTSANVYCDSSLKFTLSTTTNSTGTRFIALVYIVPGFDCIGMFVFRYTPSNVVLDSWLIDVVDSGTYGPGRVYKTGSVYTYARLNGTTVGDGGFWTSQYSRNDAIYGGMAMIY